MKTSEWHERGRSGDFIVKIEEKTQLFTILRLDKWIPDGRLLSENLFPKEAIYNIFRRNCIEPFMELGIELLQIFDECNWKYY